MRKALSPLISYVIVLGIVIMGVGIVTSMGLPLIDRMRDTAATQGALNRLQELDEAIEQVAAGSKFTTQTFQFRVRRGAYHFVPSRDQIFFQIRSESGIVSSHSSRRVGAVTLSSGAGVSVQRATINGTDCFMMESKHVEACIRDVDAGGTINTSRLLVYYHNRDTGRIIDPNVTVQIDGNTSTAWGEGYTVARSLGDRLGTGEVIAHVDSGRVAYNLTFELFNGADFLSLRVR